MSKLTRRIVSLALLGAAVGGMLFVQGGEVQASREEGVFCTIDVVVDSLNQTGAIVGRESYTREFVLTEGGRFDDDFSTRTRFKFFSASLQKSDGNLFVDVNWFADVTVFNSVDLNAGVVLADGQKTGTAVGDNTVYTSNSATRTTYTLTCTEN